MHESGGEDGAGGMFGLCLVVAVAGILYLIRSFSLEQLEFLQCAGW